MALWDVVRKSFTRGRKRNEPKRDTIQYPQLVSLGQADPHSRRKIVYKNTPKNLRYFSKTPIARRAINAIKLPISLLDWEVVPKADIEMNSELQRQCDAVTNSLRNPNDDDSFLTFCQQVIEDILCGAGAVEIGLSGQEDRPFWLWPVDGLSIHMLPGWGGGSHEARYIQTVGYGSSGQGWGNGVYLRNDELMYIRPNPTTSSPFGFGPLEIAFNSISRQLATADFAGKVSANAVPPFMIDLGDVDKDTILTMRSYWRNDVEGQGVIPIIGTESLEGSAGKTRGANVVQLYPEGDKALFLAYQEFLRTEIAAAFDIGNMNLNMERDVNRSTAEVSEDKDWDGAIKPMARLLKAHIDREIINAALGFSQIEFKWSGMDREDEDATMRILTGYFAKSIFTVNEVRAKLGEEPADHMWADLTEADIEIAKAAARSAGMILDPDLTGGGTGPPVKPAPPEPKPIAARPAPKKR